MLKLQKQSLLSLKSVQKPTEEEYAKFIAALDGFNNTLSNANAVNESEAR